LRKQAGLYADKGRLSGRPDEPECRWQLKLLALPSTWARTQPDCRAADECRL